MAYCRLGFRMAQWRIPRSHLPALPQPHPKRHRLPQHSQRNHLRQPWAELPPDLLRLRLQQLHQRLQHPAADRLPPQRALRLQLQRQHLRPGLQRHRARRHRPQRLLLRHAGQRHAGRQQLAHLRRLRDPVALAGQDGHGGPGGVQPVFPGVLLGRDDRAGAAERLRSDLQGA